MEISENTNKYNEKYKKDAELLINSLSQIYKENGNLDEGYIYKILSTCYMDDRYSDEDIRQKKESIIVKLNEFLEKNSTAKNDIRRKVQLDQGEAFTHTNITFNGKEEVGVRNNIKLYIPINFEKYEKVCEKIYKYAIKNKINMQTKITAMNRMDNFVIRVSSKEDAEKIINYCAKNKTIKNNIEYNNPFVPQMEGVGISQDTYGDSYNGKMAELLAKYVNEKRGNNTSLEDFHTYVANRGAIYNDSINAFDKESFRLKCANNGISSIISGKNPLEKIKTVKNLEFDKEFFEGYEQYIQSGKYIYISKNDGTIISEERNFKEYSKLQSMNCLRELYKYENGKVPKGNFSVCGNLRESIAKSCDDIMDINKNPIVKEAFCTKDYKMKEMIPLIDQLYPYLYTQYAIQNRGVNEKEAKRITQVAETRSGSNLYEKPKVGILNRIFRRKKTKQLLLTDKSFKEERNAFLNNYKADNSINEQENINMNYYTNNKEINNSDNERE